MNADMDGVAAGRGLQTLITDAGGNLLALVV